MLHEDELTAICEQVSGFSRSAIRQRTDIRRQNTVPSDLRRAMAEAGLFRIGIPEVYGGTGGGWLHLSVAGESLVEGGLSLGCGLFWLMQAIVARFILLGFGTEGQKASYLPGIAAGEVIPCLAISEPGVGGHPKHLSTRALDQGDSFCISGEKAYLTNGPVADLFIVLAVTAEEGGKKGYTAFLLPSDTKGLKKASPMDLGFLKPCPHGGIVLEGCPVGRDNILGGMGTAYTDMALPFRQVEDVMMTGPFIGGAQAQIGMMAESLRTQGLQDDRETCSALGEILSAVDSMRILARSAASMLDAGGPGHPGLPPVVLFLRGTGIRIQAGLAGLMERAGLQMDADYASLSSDLAFSMRIAANVARMRQEKLGRSLLS